MHLDLFLDKPNCQLKNEECGNDIGTRKDNNTQTTNKEDTTQFTNTEKEGNKYSNTHSKKQTQNRHLQIGIALSELVLDICLKYLNLSIK